MPDSHLKTLRFAAAFRDSVLSGYNREKLQADLIAGITVGIIAIPLAMALAIASGVPPQYGLYTSIVAGVVIAVTGGSRLSIRSEEHTSELQSRPHLVCRLLLEK